MVKRIKPVSRIAKFEAEINNIMGEVFSQRRDFLSFHDSWFPCIDICEKGDSYILEIELPGVFQGDITILLHSSKVEIRGVKRQVLSSEQVHYLRLEREYGLFRRVLSLPGAVIPERARAELENGILRLEMKKLTRLREKEVRVKIQKA